MSLLGPWTPLIALVGSFLPLLWAKHWITRHLQELSIRWTDDIDVALVIYFVLLLPGVLVHEFSHWLMANVLRVPVRKFSVGPVRKGSSRKVSLGLIQVGDVDPLRASLIGVAPLLGGSVVILLIGNLILGVSELTEAMSGSGVGGLPVGIGQLVQVPDFWLWLYLIFAVSNAMLPSESDRSTIRPVFIFLGIVAAILLIVGLVSAIPLEVVRGVNTIAGYLATAFAITLAVDLVFILLIVLLLWVWRRMQDR